MDDGYWALCAEIERTSATLREKRRRMLARQLEVQKLAREQALKLRYAAGAAALSWIFAAWQILFQH
jgi:hypothetical protein